MTDTKQFTAGTGRATFAVEQSEIREGYVTLQIERGRTTDAGVIFARIDLQIHELLSLALAAQRGATVLRAEMHTNAATRRARILAGLEHSTPPSPEGVA